MRQPMYANLAPGSNDYILLLILFMQLASRPPWVSRLNPCEWDNQGLSMYGSSSTHVTDADDVSMDIDSVTKPRSPTAIVSPSQAVKSNTTKGMADTAHHLAGGLWPEKHAWKWQEAVRPTTLHHIVLISYHVAVRSICSHAGGRQYLALSPQGNTAGGRCRASPSGLYGQ